MQKIWQLSVSETDASLPSDLHPLLRSMLTRRRVQKEDVDAFLRPDWDRDLHDPFLFVRMCQAVDRLLMALDRGEHLVIHGDYDADGVTGSVVLASTLAMLARNGGEEPEFSRVLTEDFYTVIPKQLNGFCLEVFIPHRERDGYGLHARTVQVLADRGVQVLVTVDCGVANVEEIAQARFKGMDVIVVDHHQFGSVLPDAIHIHPRLPDEVYPFKELAAVGVAWKLATALTQTAREQGFTVPDGWEKWMLDLVSIATVTDIVPLIGENRALEKYGLLVLNKQRRPGFRALVQSSGWKRGHLDTEAVGFMLGPRINAAGRMEHALLAVDLLMETSPELAEEKAVRLEQINRSRQQATERLMREADQSVNTQDMSLIFAWSSSWSPALVGLAAGRYADTHGKPSVFVGQHGDQWIGSGRSIPGYDLTAAISAVGADLLDRYGGHPQACGFSVSEESKLEEFAKVLRAHATEYLQSVKLRPVLEIEAEIRLNDLNLEFVEMLGLFEPFGEGNPRPVFLTRSLSVLQVGLVGAHKNHVRCLLQDATGRRQKFIGFYASRLLDVLQPNQLVDVVYEVSTSEWNGKREIQCKLTDARSANADCEINIDSVS